MRINDITTPVVVLGYRIGGLAIARSLGKLGVRVYAIDSSPEPPALFSRYCRRCFAVNLDDGTSDQAVARLLDLARQFDRPPILIPTTDETAVFVAEYTDYLKKQFRFPLNDLKLMRDLISKRGMYQLALRCDVPTPMTEFPQNQADVDRYADSATFPVMLKGIFGNQLELKTGKKMVIVQNRRELIDNYRLLEDSDAPNLMLQEYIPGGDDSVYIFNGYFDEDSNCRISFTGHKIRQYPIHVGCASLGICTWNQMVADLTIKFMQQLGYRGILDIGFRYDRRDGQFKVLDANPRIGQAFRLFVAQNGMDVARALYLDLTGQDIEASAAREGRKWLIEDYDFVSSLDYRREGTLSFTQWVKSFRGVQETAWFDWTDPLPFLVMAKKLVKRSLRWLGKRIGVRLKPAAPRALKS